MATTKFMLRATSMWIDGREHRQGDTVEVDAERGAELVELGALEAGDGDGGEEPAAPKSTRTGAKTATPRKE